MNSVPDESLLDASEEADLEHELELAVLKFPPQNRRWSTFEIPKRNGEPRQITAPRSELKELQAQISSNIGFKKNFSEEVHGFTSGRGSKTASIKLSKWLAMKDKKTLMKLKYVSIDLKDFFTSCDMSRVKTTLKELYPNWSCKAIEKATWLTTRKGVLPQGSPCSPILTNVLATELDRQLKLIANSRKGIYVRYADDILMIVENASNIVKTINQAVRSNNFIVNARKTRIGLVRSTSGFELLGLRIHTDEKSVKVSPRRKVRRRLRAALMCKRSSEIDPKLARCISSGCAHYHLGHTYALRKELQRGASLRIVRTRFEAGVTNVQALLYA